MTVTGVDSSSNSPAVRGNVLAGAAVMAMLSALSSTSQKLMKQSIEKMNQNGEMNGLIEGMQGTGMQGYNGYEPIISYLNAMMPSLSGQAKAFAKNILSQLNSSAAKKEYTDVVTDSNLLNNDPSKATKKVLESQLDNYEVELGSTVGQAQNVAGEFLNNSKLSQQDKLEIVKSVLNNLNNLEGLTKDQCSNNSNNK